MGTVTMRNLDDEVIERAKQRAKHARPLARGRAAHDPDPASSSRCRPTEFFQLADEIRERTRDRPRADSGILQREGRDWLRCQGRADRPRHELSRELVVDASVDHQMVAVEELDSRRRDRLRRWSPDLVAPDFCLVELGEHRLEEGHAGRRFLPDAAAADRDPISSQRACSIPAAREPLLEPLRARPRARPSGLRLPLCRYARPAAPTCSTQDQRLHAKLASEAVSAAARASALDVDRSASDHVCCAGDHAGGPARCPPTPSCRSPPISASCAAPRIPRSWSCRRRRWASPASRSPTATASPASSARTSRPRTSGLRFLVGCRLDLVDGTSLLCWPTDKPAYARLSSLLTHGKRLAAKGRLHADAGGRARPRRGAAVRAARRPRRRMPPSPGWPPGCGEHWRRNLYLALSHRYAGDDARRLAEPRRPRARRRDQAARDQRRPLPPPRPAAAAGRAHLHPRACADRRDAAPLLFANAERHLKPPDEMARLFRDHPRGAREHARDRRALPLLARRAGLRLPGPGQLRRPHAGRGAGPPHLGGRTRALSGPSAGQGRAADPARARR